MLSKKSHALANVEPSSHSAFMQLLCRCRMMSHEGQGLYVF